VNAEKALEPGAPLAREELESNLCYIATKKGGDADKAFAEAEHIAAQARTLGWKRQLNEKKGSGND